MVKSLGRSLHQHSKRLAHERKHTGGEEGERGRRRGREGKERRERGEREERERTERRRREGERGRDEFSLLSSIEVDLSAPDADENGYEHGANWISQHPTCSERGEWRV